MKNTLVVNFFAGPGTGKSTVMAHCFAELKWRGVDCEMSTEFAKDKVWEGSAHILDNQFYVSGKQYHRLKRLKGKVDVILTDSPLLLGMYYGNKEPKEFGALLLQHFNTFNNLNIFLERKKGYNPNGRLQTELQAIEIDKEVMKIVNTNCDEVAKITADRENIQKIVELIESKLKTLQTI
jgi:hypothetical protein